MKKNMKNFLFLFCTLFPLFVFSQEVEDKESKFPLFEFTKGDDSEKNKNWGDYHFSNESYSKAIERYIKIDNPSQYFLREGPLAIFPYKKNMFSFFWCLCSL